MMTLLPREERQAELLSYWVTNRDLFKSIYRMIVGHDVPADRKSRQLIDEILAKEYPDEESSEP